MTSPFFIRSLCGSAALALTAVVPAAAMACGFCVSLNGNPLALLHPKAIEIAVSTRAAIEKGQLKEKYLVPQEALFESGRGVIALHKVPAPVLVKALARKCNGSMNRQETWNVHFLFIDTEEACGLCVRRGAVVFEARPSTHSDARVVTTRPAFSALLTGTLSLPEARKRGLLFLEGDARAASLLTGGE
jgi:hypothetical protein